MMHDAAFAAAGIDASYELFPMSEAQVAPFVAGTRDPSWLGFQVTAPYKQLVAGLVDEVEEDAAALGAVNSVLRTDEGRLVGFNTDAPGFRAAIEEGLRVPLRRASVVVVGSGGAARAVVYACLRAGAGRLAIANRTLARATQLIEAMRDVATDHPSLEAIELAGKGFSDALRAADIAVNATTVGMIDQGALIPVDVLRPDAVLFDLVYVPAETELVRAARARGLRAANGDEMLVRQASIAFRRWTGIDGMSDVMRAALTPVLADPASQA